MHMTYATRLPNLALLHTLQSVNKFLPTHMTRPISQTPTQELPSEPFLSWEGKLRYQ